MQMNKYRLVFGTTSGPAGTEIWLTAEDAARLGDLIREVKVVKPAETKDAGPEERKPAPRKATKKAE